MVVAEVVMATKDKLVKVAVAVPEDIPALVVMAVLADTLVKMVVAAALVVAVVTRRAMVDKVVVQGF